MLFSNQGHFMIYYAEASMVVIFYPFTDTDDIAISLFIWN